MFVASSFESAPALSALNEKTVIIAAGSAADVCCLLDIARFGTTPAISSTATITAAIQRRLMSANITTKATAINAQG